MPCGLKRYYGTGALHFITCSCYHRQPFLATTERRDLLLTVLEKVRERYRLVVAGYIVMPEHFRLLISEPEIGTPSIVMQAVKLGFARRVLSANPHFSRTKRTRNGAPAPEFPDTERARNGVPDVHDEEGGRHVWRRRFYDFNVWSEAKLVEKLRHMHRNPVVRGLVERPEDWRWSSFRSYASGEAGIVRVNDWSR